jgi:transposase
VISASQLSETLEALRAHMQSWSAEGAPVLEQLEALSTLQQRLVAERDRYHELYLDLLERCKKLEQGILSGHKAERLEPVDAQLTLSLLATLLGARQPAAADADAEIQQVAGHTRRKPTGRKPLPEHLPRVELEILPDEVQQQGLAAFEQIGAEVSEVVERRPSSLVVVRVIRPKFVRRERELLSTRVHMAPPPELPIERGLAGPGLLADTLVKRWQDHLPLHRQEQIWAREGLELSRSTICTWHAQLAELATPLVEAMGQDALTSPYLCADATGVLVQARERCRKGHFWVVIAPERHVLFGYSTRHDSQAVDRLLGGYQGYLVADAHAVYDHLYQNSQVVEVGCWSHCRRYFFKALESEPERAREALAFIGALFEIEREVAQKPSSKRQVIRQERSGPIVEKFFAWCDRQVDQVLEDTPLAKGVGYARNQRPALQRFLEDGRLPLHNNGSELQLRRQVVGRRNWLFVGSDEAAEVNTTFVSLLASAQLHALEPWSYLRDLLCLLPRWPKRRVLELAPAYWSKTLAEPETQRLLAANVFRPVTLRAPP